MEARENERGWDEGCSKHRGTVSPREGGSKVREDIEEEGSLHKGR